MVFFALTELMAEIAVWTLRKTARYSWRGLWWGIAKIQSSSGSSGSSGTDNLQKSKTEEDDNVELRVLVKQLQAQVEEQQEKLQSLSPSNTTADKISEPPAEK